MSIITLANGAIARRSDLRHSIEPHQITLPEGLSIPAAKKEHFEIQHVDEAAGGSRLPAPDAELIRGNQPLPAGNAVDTAIHVVFGYVPTEILTLYVAVLAFLHQANKIGYAEWRALWVFLIATPVVVWLVYAGKLKTLLKPLPLSPREWPVWEMIAATIAFFAWAFALPSTPFSESPGYSPTFAGIIVLVTSTVLGLLAPIFQRAIKP